LGPVRIPYRRLFGILRLASEYISETLARSLYKFRIEYRQPAREGLYLSQGERKLLEGKSTPKTIKPKS